MDARRSSGSGISTPGSPAMERFAGLRRRESAMAPPITSTSATPSATSGQSSPMLSSLCARTRAAVSALASSSFATPLPTEPVSLRRAMRSERSIERTVTRASLVSSPARARIVASPSAADAV